MDNTILAAVIAGATIGGGDEFTPSIVATRRHVFAEIKSERGSCMRFAPRRTRH